MQYRDFMMKYRPVFAPDGPAAGGGTEAAAAAAGDSGQAPAATPAASDGGATDAGGAAAAAPAEAPAAGGEAPAATGEAAPPAGEPTLLEAAEGKKPAAEAAGETKEQPAPADAAKPDADPAAGDKKPAEGDAKDPKADPAKESGDKGAAETDPAKKDATAENQPPAPIKYDAFKLPDGVKLDDERLSKFTEVAGKGQVTQEVAQDLVNLHIEEMQRLEKDIQERATQHQQDVWKGLNDGWKAELRKDEKLGGNRIETNLSMAKAVLEEYGGTPEQVRDLLAHTKANGMGNYPGFIRLLVNIGEALNVFEEGTVAGDTSPARPQRGPGNRGWYDKSNMNGAAKP